MIRSRKALLLGLAVLAAVTLASCAAGPNNVAHVNASHIAGFWQGLWHGFICPVTLIISLFTERVSVYDVHNNGNWYDFGFVLGVSVIFGGSHGPKAARRRQPHRIAS